MINVYWYEVQVFSIYKFIDMLPNEIATMLQVEKNRDILVETWEEFLSLIAISMSSWRWSDLLAVAGSKIRAKFPWLTSNAITHHLRKTSYSPHMISLLMGRNLRKIIRLKKKMLKVLGLRHFVVSFMLR